MAFYTNIGYQFDVPDNVEPDGSVILASAMPMHQLMRRKLGKHPFLERRLFDPQLYMAGLEAEGSPKHCMKLASYPWFGCEGQREYDSSVYTQKEWSAEALKQIGSIWTGKLPTKEKQIRQAVIECINFQIRLGCEAIILPSPLTVDPGGQYTTELQWLDIGLESVSGIAETSGIPIFASVAISDVCLRYLDPSDNQFLDIIADSISARGVDGVYFILEQGGELAESRQCGSARVLEGVLHFVHMLSIDCGIRVAVNFLGAFGLACEAAGAEIWASQWYKSLYRFRLQDKLGVGRAYPLYWTRHGAVEIHLEEDFDRLNKSGMLQKMMDVTNASKGLNQIVGTERKVGQVPAWRYAQSNVSAIKEHFLLSSIQAESELAKLRTIKGKQQYIEDWLKMAAAHAGDIEAILKHKKLDPPSKTRTEHVSAWFSAFKSYRRTHEA